MRLIMLLGLVFALPACGDPSRPPTVGSGPPGGSVGTTDAGPDDAGASDEDGSGGVDAGDGGTFVDGGIVENGVFCTPTPSAGNVLRVNTTAMVAFEPEVAFATWTPDVCSPIRSLSIGFDTTECGLDNSELLQFVVDEADILSAAVVAGSPLVPALGSAVTIRLRANDGDVVRRWGNCVGTSGSVTFVSLSTTPGDFVTMNFNVTATDCDGGAAPSVTLIGNLAVRIPTECETP